MAQHIGVVGASGYGGAELLRLLANHPAMDVEVVAAHAQAGTPVPELFPNLAGQSGGGATVRTFDDVDPDRLAGLDLVFLATPHGPALELGAALHDAGTPVVDLSAAFRLSARGFETWYGEVHPRPDLAAGETRRPDSGDGAAAGTRDGVAADTRVGTAGDSGDGAAAGTRAYPTVAYGLPERHRDTIRTAGLVANPGCYPTAALLALAPIAELVEPGSVVIDAKSGTSGAGRAATERLQFSTVHGDLVAYGAPAHRHTGEIETWLPGELGPVSFTPHLVPMSRGLLATCYATVRAGVDASAVQDALHDAYETEPFVHLLPPGSFPHTKALAGSNGCQVSAVADPRTGRVVVTSAIDNLGKGAAGQALQNANLLLGIDETAGLTAIGVFP